MKDIWLLIGTRPEAVKMCPLVPALTAAGFSPHILLTSQHSDLLTAAMDAFGLSADGDLSLFSPGQDLPTMLSRITAGVGAFLSERGVHFLLVHGDTLTALGGAMAAFLSGVPYAHVEAGLRTGDLTSPFPEEYCRRVIALSAAFHFAPTGRAKENLLREGVRAEKIAVTGNTGLDAFAYTLRPTFSHPALEAAARGRLLLLTVHRRENRGPAMRGIFAAVRRLAAAFPDVIFFCPLHPSTAVQKEAHALAGRPRIILAPPQDPVTFHNLLARAYLVMTDSGGLQEEAAFLHIPTLVLRKRTEREEGLSSGALCLCGTEEESVFQTASLLLSNENAHRTVRQAENPFGTGHAAEKIAAILARIHPSP